MVEVVPSFWPPLMMPSSLVESIGNWSGLTAPSKQDKKNIKYSLVVAESFLGNFEHKMLDLVVSFVD